MNCDLESNIGNLSINTDISPIGGTLTEDLAGHTSGEDRNDEVFGSDGQRSPERSEAEKVRSQSLLEHMDSSDREQMEEGE